MTQVRTFSGSDKHIFMLFTIRIPHIECSFLLTLCDDVLNMCHLHAHALKRALPATLHGPFASSLWSHVIHSHVLMSLGHLHKSLVRLPTIHRSPSHSSSTNTGEDGSVSVFPFASMNIIKELESKRAESAIEKRYTECFNSISCFTPIAADTLVFGYLTGAIRIISLGDLLGSLFEYPAGYRKPTEAGDGGGTDAGAAATPSASAGGTTASASAAPPRLSTNVFHDAVPTGGAIDVIHAHTGSVTKLLHPFYHGATVDSSIFVSGSADCCIKVWNLGTHLHTFKNQAGVVVNLLCPPANSSLLRRGCFCSISSDHSFAIYSIDAMSCMHMISGLSAPVHEVRWRAADDYVVLWCGGEHNHTVYVWQLSSGHLDRKATGQLALDILAACPAPAPAHGLAGHVTRKVLLAQGIGFQVYCSCSIILCEFTHPLHMLCYHSPFSDTRTLRFSHLHNPSPAARHEHRARHGSTAHHQCRGDDCVSLAKIAKLEARQCIISQARARTRDPADRVWFVAVTPCSQRGLV